MQMVSDLNVLGPKKTAHLSPIFCIHFSNTQHLRFPAPKRTGLEEVYCCLAEFWRKLPGTARFSQLQCTLLFDGPIMTYPYIQSRLYQTLLNYLSYTANLRHEFSSQKKSMHGFNQFIRSGTSMVMEMVPANQVCYLSRAIPFNLEIVS